MTDRYGPAGEVLRLEDRKYIRRDFERRVKEGRIGMVESTALACWFGAEANLALLTPWQKTVEKIAALIGGPVDGNLVAHVEAYMEGAARFQKERDEYMRKLEEALQLALTRTEERNAARDNHLRAMEDRDAAYSLLGKMYAELNRIFVEQGHDCCETPENIALRAAAKKLTAP